jgi:hypothetical protein
MMSEKKNLFDCSFKGEPAAVYKALVDLKSEDTNVIRQRLEDLYGQHAAFLDDDFYEKFPLATNQRYWELSLAHFLRQQFTLEKNPQKKQKKKCPDFSFKHEGQTIWIEAVTPTQGTKENRVPDRIINWPPEVSCPPKEKIILRYQTSLRAKAKYFQSCKKESVVKDEDVQIIALSSADLPTSTKTDGATGDPFILSALFPIGDYQIHHNRSQIVGGGYSYQEDRINANGASVSYFFKPSELIMDKDIPNAHITGVLYHDLDMCILLNDEWENIHKNQMYFIHNPFAKNPIPKGLFQCGHEYTAEYNGDGGWRRRISRTPEVI